MVTVEPVPAGATVQVVTMVELASFSMTECPATSTVALTSRTRDSVACNFHVATVPCTLAALEHLVTAVVRRRGSSDGPSGSRRPRRGRLPARH